MKTMILSAIFCSFLALLISCGGGGSGASAQTPAPVIPVSPITPPTPPTPIDPLAPGPAFIQGFGPNNVGWVGCVDYELARDGNGCFFQFISQSKSGKAVSGVTLNGGLIDATAGNEQGDLDIVLFVDGQPATVAILGSYPGQAPAILASPSGKFALGGPNNAWKEVFLTEFPCPVNIPGAAACVRINGGSVPIYR